MFKNAAYNGDTEQSLKDRFRQIAFWTAVLGLCILAFVSVVYSRTGALTWLVRLEIAIYASVLAIIVGSAQRRWHVKPILIGGMVSLFAVFWAGTFAEAIIAHAVPFDLPMILFIPLFLSMILGHRLLFALAPVQAACVYIYTCEFMDWQTGIDWTREDQQVYSMMLAVVSGFSFCMFGSVAFARTSADNKLFALISEQEKLAATDGLTGLQNRRAFMDTLRHFWPKQKNVGIAFIDLDHFKPLNDQYGHAVGDEILKTIATRIDDFPMVSATARLGGDEFAVLFQEDSEGHSVDQLINLLHAKITADIKWESGLISMGASIGYAEGNTMKQTLSGLLRSADTAMRRAKSSRLGWAIFNPRIDNAALASSTLEVELKSAIKNGEIRAAIQPIANAKTRQTVAYELLARWTDSGFERDPSPKDFIPIAEKLGLLNEILWVTLDEALAHLDLNDLRLAINVSPAQLLASDFLDTLLSILDRHEVSPNSITIEITEEVAFRNLDRNITILEQARALGITIALDDFGTGYSSLSMLDTLPLDKLKIDQSFVQKSDKSEQSKSILLAAIRLAKQLGLESCVEGIETQEFAARVAVLGADHIQGYWLGRPALVRDVKREQLKLVS